ncbi:MAG: hypothetical protein JW731_09335 [Bacteroidales bacterium]|nr:hypothetical protein [Bacteroidales bacterium]
MRCKAYYRISLAVNGLFLITLITLGYLFREDIFRGDGEEVDNPKIVMFGDSLIEMGNWQKLLGQTDLLNHGIGGFTTSHFIWVIHKKVIKYQPEICIMDGGINDISVGIPLDRTIKNYRSLIDTLLLHGVQPIVNSTVYQRNNPFSKVMVDSLNQFLNEYCNQKGVIYLDINSKLSSDKGLKPEYTTDGTHLTPDAYQIWGTEIKRVLSEPK